MNTIEITKYSNIRNQFYNGNFEDALLHATHLYSLQHLVAAGIITEDEIASALEKAMLVCKLAGIDSKIHFKKIFIYDSEQGAIFTDWLMSKKGLHLVLLQFPLLNEFIARWLLQLSE